jgi:transcription elongation factor Elf1
MPAKTGQLAMKCYNCQSELIWGGDHDYEVPWEENESEFSIITNLSCPNCGTYHEVYTPKELNFKDIYNKVSIDK